MDKLGRLNGINRFGEQRPRSSLYGYEDERGMRHLPDDEYDDWSWSRDTRSEASSERRSHGVGKGPKGYRRPDIRIREEVCERLTDDFSIDPTDVEVSVSEGFVTLTGSVEDRFMKKHIEAAIDDIKGVIDIHNHLTLRKKVDGWIPHLPEAVKREQEGQ